MPELPEVETMVRLFKPRLEGRTIARFDSSWKKNVAPSYAQVSKRLAGQTIQHLSRRAKYIVMHLDRGYLLVHLRMSGRLEWAADHEIEPSHVRAVWTFVDRERLLFCDARKFGRIVFADDLDAVTADLGIEPLGRSFTVASVSQLLRERRRQLKPLLLDQSVIAGLGNIYADEALFRAGLHPLMHSADLHSADCERLHEAIRWVLRKAIRLNGSSIDWMYPGGKMQESLMVYARGGEPCRVCATPIEKTTVAQRGTHICPNCQPVRERP
jgi:formamidopyrimidine-DNA glycosylase